MCEKFSFHGFARQASALNLAYRSYIPDLLNESEKMNRLSMVKFLLCMSQAPTKHFLEHPEVLVNKAEQPEEVIDWGAYLNEGIEQWNPKFEESSVSNILLNCDSYSNTYCRMRSLMTVNRVILLKNWLSQPLNV